MEPDQSNQEDELIEELGGEEEGNNKVLVILAVIAGVIVVIAVVVSLIVFLTNRGEDQKNEAIESEDVLVEKAVHAIIVDAIAYADKTDSVSGYKKSAEIELPSCSGEPIINISPDGKEIAVFGKSCLDEKKYFCRDFDLNKEEVSDNYAKSGRTTCIENPMNLDNISSQGSDVLPQEDLVELASEHGFGIDIGSDSEIIKTAKGYANEWKTDSRLKFIGISKHITGSKDPSEKDPEIIIMFGSKSAPDKVFMTASKDNKSFKLGEVSTEIFSSFAGAGYENIKIFDELGYINLADVKINAAEAFVTGGNYLINNYPNLVIDRYGKYSMLLVYDKNYNAHLWVLMSDKDGEEYASVAVDAVTGRITVREPR